MKLLIIIGTRPQYIKIKPFYDYIKNNNIDSVLVDTTQHYSFNVSSVFINEFNLEINYYLKTNNINSISFISDCIVKINEVIGGYNPDIIIVIGDTNSTLAGALVARKKGIKLAHLEAVIRCGDKNRPEEINRILTDELSDLHFTSRREDNKNVSNPFYVGDLEYTLLNWLEEQNYFGEISYEDFLLMTIHRDENTNVERLTGIFDFCGKLKDRIIFPIHHRTKKIVDDYNISIPDNIEVCSPMSYKEMTNLMSKCGGLISDSGGIIKTSPYFGKKCLIPLEITEWIEVIEKGYGGYGQDINFFKEKKIKRDKDFYYVKNNCKLIIDKLNELFKS